MMDPAGIAAGIAYVTAGILLSSLYLPTIRRYWSGGAVQISALPRCVTGWSLRMLTLPYVFMLGNKLVLVVLVADCIGRGLELAGMLRALRRLGTSWIEIAGAIWPSRRYPRNAQTPQALVAEGGVVAEMDCSTVVADAPPAR